MLFPHWKSVAATEALLKVYAILARRYSLQTIDFLKHPEARIAGGALSIIEKEVDHHRTNTGVMIYPSVEICNFGGSIWLLGFGSKGGSYPGDKYAYDILAMEWPSFDKERFPIIFEEHSLGNLCKEIGDANDASLFSVLPHSVVIAMSDGTIVLQKAFQTLGKFDIKDYVLKGPRYRRDFPEMLAQSLAAYFRDWSPAGALPNPLHRAR